MTKSRRPSETLNNHASYLFSFLLLANFIQYMEAGAVPALLVTIAESFEMDAGQQGLLGGVVYLSLGIGGPFAGYLLRRYEHKIVIVCAVAANMLFTILWATTPIHHSYSTTYYIVMRFMMGLCQCIICVYLPLWTSENAPRDKRTIWMSYLQASVPLGVMMGYIVASIFMNFAHSNITCGILFCWRWPFLIQISLLSPLYLALYLVPSNHMALSIQSSRQPLPETTIVTQNSSSVNLNEDSTSIKANLSDDSHTAMSTTLPDTEKVIKSDLEINKNVKDVSKSKNTQKFMSSLLLSQDLSERRRRLTLRRHSMHASMFDPLYARDIVRRSVDDLSVYEEGETTDSLLDLFFWGNHNHSNSNDTQLSHNKKNNNLPSKVDFNMRNNVASPELEDGLFLALDEDDDDPDSENRKKNNTDKPPHPRRFLPNQRQSFPLYKSTYGSTAAVHSDVHPVNNHFSTKSETAAVVKAEDLKYESLRDLQKSRKRGGSSSGFSSPMTHLPQAQNGAETGEKEGDEAYYHHTVNNEFEHQEYSVNDQSNDQEDENVDNLSSSSESEEEWISPVKPPRRSDTSMNSGHNSNTSIVTTEEQQHLLVQDANNTHNNSNSGGEKKKMTWIRTLKRLMSLSIYRNILGAMTCLYFTVTGVQFWGTKYLTVSLNAPLMLVNTLFVLCAATGPTFGVFFGGWIVDLMGGYKGRKKRCSTLYICCILGIGGFVCSIPITFCTSIFSAIIFLWLALFFGAATLPACSGILVSIVPRDMRPFSSSLSMMVFNMFGYFASLILSGYLMQMLEAKSPVCNTVCAMTWGFRLILFWSFFSVIFVLSAYRTAKMQVEGMERRRSIRQQNRLEEIDPLPSLRLGEVEMISNQL